jgi:hypothetical protein
VAALNDMVMKIRSPERQEIQCHLGDYQLLMEGYAPWIYISSSNNNNNNNLEFKTNFFIFSKASFLHIFLVGGVKAFFF